MNGMEGIALESCALMLVGAPLLAVFAVWMADMFRSDRHTRRMNAMLQGTLERRK